MKLPDLQVLLQDSIVTMEPFIDPFLQTPPKGTVADRVAIYANGYYARLEEALGSDYGTLIEIIGEDEFSELSERYIGAYPSYSYTLNFLGLNLSKYMAETLPYSKKQHLAEIAAFEWAEAQTVTAHDATVLLASDLQALPANQWPEYQFSLHPSCTFVTLHWNSLALIEASRNEKPIPRAKKLKAPQTVLIWRRHLDVRYYVPTNIELTMLRAIESKASFVALCEHLSNEMPEEEVANFLVQELYAWINEKLLVHSL